MKYLLIILGPLIVSCTDTNKKTTVTAPKNSFGSATDTLYHNTDNDILKTQKIDVYNTTYTSIIAPHTATSQNISYKIGTTVHIHPRKSVKITTLHLKDTISIHTLNLHVLKKHYDVFYEKLNHKFPEYKTMAFPEITKNRLDSIRLIGAREHHIYYAAYIKNYNTTKRYTLEIGIPYLNHSKNDYLISQLQYSN